MTDIFKTLFKGQGSATINGITYSGKTITIRDGVVIVDGDICGDVSAAAVLNVSVTGSVNQLTTTSGGVSVDGHCGYIETTSGDVGCGDVLGSVKTVSGDVYCRAVTGSVSTVSGDITHR